MTIAPQGTMRILELITAQNGEITSPTKEINNKKTYRYEQNNLQRSRGGANFRKVRGEHHECCRERISAENEHPKRSRLG